jgi:hypothetical protein
MPSLIVTPPPLWRRARGAPYVFDRTNSLQHGSRARVGVMPEAKIILFETNSRAHRVRRELEDWRRRLRLAYARQWDWRAREICKMEIRRLGDLARDIPRDDA